MFKSRQIFMEEAPADGGAGAGGAGATESWYSGFKDPEVKGWMESLNGAYPDAESVATKAYHLEKFMGADKAGRGVILPKADAKPEEWQEFYKKVGGVPEKAEDYALPNTFKPEQVAELNADPMIASFREYAHKAGMPPAFFQAAMNWYAEQTAGATEKAFADFEAKSNAELEELKTEWAGVEYDKNVELGKRAAAQFLPHSNPEELADAVTRLEGAFGTKGAMKLLANIGKAMSEDSFVAGEGTGGNLTMSPAAARVRIDALKRDSGFTAKLTSGDAQAMQEWNTLHKVAFG